jgi:hypothetical protein
MKRESMVALIVNIANACPFKYNHHFFKCIYCDEPFKIFEELLKHIGSKHQNVTELEIRKVVGKFRTESKIKVNFVAFTCNICDDTLNDYKEMKIHLVAQHDKPVNVEDDGILPYKILDGAYNCVICGDRFMNFMRLNKHITSHFMYFVCNRCGVGCESARRLSQHKILKHPDRPHCCRVCTKTFTTAYFKKRHESKVHLEKDYKCKKCPNTFKDINDKRKHMEAVHGKETFVESEKSSLGLRQSNNLKTVAKLEKYEIYGIDTSRDKSRGFDLVSFTS